MVAAPEGATAFQRPEVGHVGDDADFARRAGGFSQIGQISAWVTLPQTRHSRACSATFAISPASCAIWPARLPDQVQTIRRAERGPRPGRRAMVAISVSISSPPELMSERQLHVRGRPISRVSRAISCWALSPARRCVLIAARIRSSTTSFRGDEDRGSISSAVSSPLAVAVA